MNHSNSLWRLWLTLCLVGCALLAGCSKQDDNSEQIINAHLKRSHAYKNQGQYKAALIEARNIVKKDPSNTLGHKTLANILLEIGNTRSAVSTLEPISKQSADPEIQLLLARAYYGIGKFYSARTALQNYVKQQGNTEISDYVITLARIEAATGQREQAINALRQLMKNPSFAYEAEKALATLYFSLGDTPSAEQLITNLVGQDREEDPEALYLAAQVAYLNNNLDLAEKHLTNALITLPSTDLIIPLRAKILSQLSTVLTEQGRTSEALIYSRLLASENPELHEAKTMLSDALDKIQENDLETAEQLLLKLNTEYPNFEPGAIYLGLVSAKRGKLDKADLLLSAHLDPEVSSPTLISASVMNKLRLNQIEDSLSLLQDALQVHPKNEKLLTLYGQVAINQPQYQEHAALALEKAIALNPDNVQARIPLARYYLAHGKAERGLAQLEQSLKISPSDVSVVASYASLMKQRGKHEKAQAAVDRLIEVSPNEPGALNLAAGFAAADKSYDDAEKLFNKALQIAPENFEARLGLAEIAMARGRLDEAIKVYTDLIKSAPTRAEGFKGLITAYELKQAPAKGLDSVKQLADPKTAETPTPAYVLAEYYLRKKDFQSAADYFQQGFSMEPESHNRSPLGAALYFTWARDQLSSGKFDEARPNLMTALGYSPSNSQVMGTLAELEIKAQRYAEAARVIDEIAETFPDTAQAELLIGKLAEAQKKTDQALAAYRKGWAKQPSDLAGQLIYETLKQNQQKADALRFLDEWISTLPRSQQARILKATHLQLSGALQPAEALYARVLQDNPNNVTALNNLAWLYDSNNDDRAVLIAERAYQAAPGNPEVMDTYGWLLFKSGKAAEGVALMERAQLLLPDNQEIRSHLETARSQN